MNREQIKDLNAKFASEYKEISEKLPTFNSRLEIKKLANNDPEILSGIST